MPKIELDDIDIGILAFLTDDPQSTTSDVAKALFKEPFNLRKLDCFIRYRLRRFMEEDIVKQTRLQRKSVYTVDGEKVFFGNGLLEMNGHGKIDMGYFVVIKKGSETIAKSIDDYERRIGAKTFHEQTLNKP